jgi:hypothetical protein
VRPNRARRRAAARVLRRVKRGFGLRARPSILAALTASALALPGLAPPARADTPVDRWSIATATSFYIEDDLDSGQAAPGTETSRYEVRTQQLELRAPFTDRTDLALEFVHESMSGATPWFVEPDGNGEPVQVMSGATVKDERQDLLGTGSYYLDNGRLSLRGGLSTENDYFSGNGGVEAAIDFNEKTTTLSSGFGFSFDTIEPTDANLFPTRVDEEEKQSYSMFASVSQVLNRAAALQSGLTLQHSTGFLSDPYKLISVGGVNLADSRPDTRNQLTWLTRYRQHFERLAGTLHADYRFYLDDWEIYSHTIELAWYQELFDRFRLIPSLRYYDQSQASFYAPYFLALPSDGLASSDYRLSPYGALSWKLKAEAALNDWPAHMDWIVGLAWERYLSGGNLALGDVRYENPGLVSFNVFTLSLSARF